MRALHYCVRACVRACVSSLCMSGVSIFSNYIVLREGRKARSGVRGRIQAISRRPREAPRGGGKSRVGRPELRYINVDNCPRGAPGRHLQEGTQARTTVASGARAG